MNRKSVFQLFLEEECNAGVRDLLLRALADESNARPHYELNRFEVTVDREAGVVRLEDMLDSRDSAIESITVQEFRSELERLPPRTR